MVNFNDSIDVTIFMAMQVSKKCLELGDNRPVLFLSNPGIGKSTAVSLFAEVNDYDLVLLRISNETPDTLTGYDVASNTTDENTTAAKHIRPSWFQKILDNDKAGKKSVLFLDEITTSDPYTQGAALNLVFDRRCHAEYLPASTLIVAAGNYANNLTSEMTVLAPMLNRFIIVNIIPSRRDLPHFLCKYEGSGANKKIDFKGEIRKAMQSLKDQEKNIKATPEQIDVVGELIEKAIQDEASVEIQDGTLDLAVTDLKDVYSSVSGDDPVPNYFTLRSANYLLDAAVACYLCFGKDGLCSDNFKKMIHGTVGLAVSRDSNNHEVKCTIVTDRYYQALIDVANNIQKLFDKRLPEYHKFFNEILSDKTEFTKSDIELVTSKIEQLMKDKQVENIDRPIEYDVIKNITNYALNTLKTNSYKNVSTTNVEQEIQNDLKQNPEKFAGFVNTWNSVCRLATTLRTLTNEPSKKYDKDTKEIMNKFIAHCREYSHQLRVIKRIIAKTDKAISEAMPSIASF